MGLGCNLAYSESKDDPESVLLVNGLIRDEVYSRRKAAKVRARLMREAWRPQDFRTP
jgi:hypothetical protein